MDIMNDDNKKLDESAYLASKMCALIYEAIYNAPEEMIPYTPDAMIRVLVYLCKSNGWNLERIKKETDFAIEYYFKHNCEVIANCELIPLDDGIPTEQIPVDYINVNGREEHEALLRDEAKMLELGLDPMYERMVYLTRWGGWLGEPLLQFGSFPLRALQ